MKLIGDKLFQLAKDDLLKGFVMAFLTALATAVYTQLNADAMHIPTFAELLLMGKAALSVAIIYLLKNFLSNSDDKFAKPEPKKPTE